MTKLYLILLLPFIWYNSLKAQRIISEPTERYGQHTDEVTCGLYSADNAFIYTGGWDGKIIAYKNHDSTPVWSGDVHYAAIRLLTLSRDGKSLYSAGNDLVIKQTETIGFTQVQTFKGHSGNITAVIPDAVGKFLFSGSEDGTIRVWDILNPAKVKVIQAGQSVFSLALSLDGRSIYAGLRSGQIVQFDLLGKTIRTFEGHKDAVKSICYSFNNKFLYSASNDKTIIVWDVKEGKLLKTISAHTWSINSLQQTNDSKYLISGSSDGTSKVFEVESGKELFVISSYGTEIRQAYLSPDKKFILVSAKENSGRENWGSYSYPIPMDSLYPQVKKDTSKTLGTQKQGPNKNTPGGSQNQKQGGTNPPKKPQDTLPSDSVRMTQVPDSSSIKIQQKLKQNTGKNPK